MPTWKQGWMGWNSLTERQIETIGRHIESIQKQVENEYIYPSVSVRNPDGSWTVSSIVEAAVIRLARDVQKIDADTWKKYQQVYQENWKKREEGGEHKLHITEAMSVSLDKVVEYLKKAAVIEIMQAGKVNLKLIYSMALTHTVSQIG